MLYGHSAGGEQRRERAMLSRRTLIYPVGQWRLVKRSMSIAAAIIAVAASPAKAGLEGHAEGPKSLLITYRAEASHRPAFRHFLAHHELARLAAWKRRGAIANYQILFNPVVTDNTWDAMLVLNFARFEDTAKWLAIERTSPGGLSPVGLSLGKPVSSYAADIDWEGGKGGATEDAGAIFYVIPYEYRAEAEYHRYIDGYVLPQIKGWMREGVLSGYRILMNRYPVGKPWDSLFILRYRDLSSFGKREATIAKVRVELQSDPAWVKWNENKAGMRTESENVVSQALQTELVGLRRGFLRFFRTSKPRR